MLWISWGNKAISVGRAPSQSPTAAPTIRYFFFVVEAPRPPRGPLPTHTTVRGTGGGSRKSSNRVIDSPPSPEAQGCSMSNQLKRAAEILMEQEGFREWPYLDTRGFRTVGFGTRLPLSEHEHAQIETFRTHASAAPPILTTAALWPITRGEGEALLIGRLDIKRQRLERGALAHFNIRFDELPDPAKLGLLDAAYQLGVAGLLDFRLMWGFIRSGMWMKAGQEAKRSRWARQTPSRAARLCRYLESCGPIAAFTSRGAHGPTAVSRVIRSGPLASE